MKKVLFALIILTITFASCKKGYTCTCTSSGIYANPRTITINASTQAEAATQCSQAAQVTETCVLVY